MDTDGFLKKIGQFGPFQKRVLAMFLFIFFPITYQTLIMVFVAYEPPWMCTTNSTACLQANATGREVFSTSTKPIALYERRCSLNRSDWKFADYNLYEGPHKTIVTELLQWDCVGVFYLTTTVQKELSYWWCVYQGHLLGFTSLTMVYDIYNCADFDLVCGRSIYGWLANSILFFGWAVGALVLGAISDKYGRRSVLFPSITLVIVLTFCLSFSKVVSLAIALRFFVGVFEGGSVLTMFVLSAELVGPSKRALSSTLVWFYFALALMILGLKAFFIRDWRLLCIISSVPFLFVLIFWKFVPESVRWLLVFGHKDKALEILQKVAKVNKKEMPKEDLNVPYSPPNKGCFELFANKKLVISTLIQCYAWFVNGMVYYGVSMSAGELGGSIYLNFVLTSLVEIPANLFVIDNCNRFGRKKTVVWHFIAGAIACVAVSFIPAGTNNTGYIVGRVAGGMLGKLFITVSFNSIYVFSAELFPTVVRNSGMGLMTITSRVGAATAPFIVQLTRVNSVLPFAVMGVATIVAAIGCWFLPETNGKPTREVIGDGEEEKNANKVLLTDMKPSAENGETNDNSPKEKEDKVEDEGKETEKLMEP